MDKTFAYWFEKLIGCILGIISFCLTYKYWNLDHALNQSKYYDVIIKASSSLFGFLLAILALVVNGANNNSNIQKMKEKGSFERLVRYHKVAVLLAFFLVVYSVIIYSIIETKNGINNFGYVGYKLMVSFHTGASIWAAVDTTIFVLIFYKILLTSSKK